MDQPANVLKSFAREHDFFVAVDSDGSAFDSMELKQKRCFIPCTIEHWNLQSVSELARQTAEFVNLYSRWRGVNRFPALVKTLDLLAGRDEALRMGYRPPDIEPLRRWTQSETRLSQSALAAAASATGEPVLQQALAWTRAIDDAVAKLAADAPLFANVAQSLQKLHPVADVLVASTAPTRTLQREWNGQNVAQYVRLIAGQEAGSKSEQIRLAAVGRYEPRNILMIGDAPADLHAARECNARFFPILASNEAASWARFHDESLGRFLSGRYGGEYEEKLVKEFLANLPETPPWENQ